MYNKDEEGETQLKTGTVTALWIYDNRAAWPLTNWRRWRRQRQKFGLSPHAVGEMTTSSGTKDTGNEEEREGETNGSSAAATKNTKKMRRLLKYWTREPSMIPCLRLTTLSSTNWISQQRLDHKGSEVSSRSNPGHFQEPDKMSFSYGSKRNLFVFEPTDYVAGQGNSNFCMTRLKGWSSIIHVMFLDLPFSISNFTL